MMSQLQQKIKRYPLESSPLFKLSSKRKLAQLLNVDYALLANFHKSDLPNQYCIFTDNKTLRLITEPKDELLAVHKQLLKLFVRISPPQYIHSAIKKRSYKTNAEVHIKAEKVIKIDIRKFFPSVGFHYIHTFFLKTLMCAPDISVILAKLCTVKTKKYGVHLPTGSCISPILSFLANKKLFDEIALMSEQQGCAFSLYVDDITISGTNATREFLSLIAAQIHKHGYGYHKFKVYHKAPAKVTGLIVFQGLLTLPYIRSKKIRDLAETLEVAKGPSRAKLLASLVGRLAEAEQINPAYKRQRLYVMSKYSAEWDAIVEVRSSKSKANR